jgi:hypothetical protein
MRRTFFAFASFAFLAGCSASSSRDSSFNTSLGTGGNGSSGTPSTSTGAGAGPGGTGGGFVIDSGLPDAGMFGPAEVFGETADTLYKLDPVTNAITTVGAFQGCNDSVIDIAINKSGQMYATTFSGFYSVDKTTAVCTHIQDGSYPNSLSFVPAGTLTPTSESLVGYVGAQYVLINTTTGTVAPIGTGLTGGYESSGDIVSVINGGTYLTVNGNDCSSSDCIIEVDPVSGDLKSMIGQLGHSDVFGLAFWGGSAYGFDDTGHVFQIDLTNAMTTEIPVPNAPSGLSWYGAGSTTDAPLTPTTM